MSRSRFANSVAVSPSKMPRGPNGRRLCRQCSTEVGTSRQTFCSRACVDEWSVRRSGSFARRLVQRRDHGVCALCGLDTERLERLLCRLSYACQRIRNPAERATFERPIGPDELLRRQRAAVDAVRRSQAVRSTGLARLGVAGAAWAKVVRVGEGGVSGLWVRHLWEADHVVPVIEGGGACGLDNLQTLCVPCHRAATRELRARLARSRQAKN